MTQNSKTPNPTHSPREHVLEHIYEVLRDDDRSDPNGTAMELLDWIEARLLGKDRDGSAKYANPDHPVEFL